jgi:hypothetical protein
MPKKRHTPEEIVTRLRRADVMFSQGQPLADAVRVIGVIGVVRVGRMKHDCVALG